MTIEEKLRVLAECGFRLKEPFGVGDLEQSWGREALEGPGFESALVCLGMTQEEPPWTPHCDNLWHFDSECIEGDGSYVRIAQRLAEMTQGALAISEVRDRVDFDRGEAWLEFTCGGRTVHIDLAVEDDFADFEVVGQFAALLKASDPNKVYVHYALEGQDCIIGCTTRAGFERLKKVAPGVKALG